jgi:hypothetical protein
VVRGTHANGTFWRKGTNEVQANVMLAYPIPEAEQLLESKFTAAQESLDNCEEDLDFLREQITVCFWRTLGIAAPDEMLIDMYRHLRLRRQGCTTGMLLCVEKRKSKVILLRWKMERLRRRMAEPC